MEELFRLIRVPFLPLPLILWTVLWPLLLAGVVCIVIPVTFIGTTLICAVGSPFILLGAAYTNEPERIRKYFDGWRQINKKARSMVSDIEIAHGYTRIFAWGDDPKSVPDTGWIVGTANVIGVLLIEAAISEIVRIVLGILLALIVILIVIGLVNGDL